MSDLVLKLGKYHEDIQEFDVFFSWGGDTFIWETMYLRDIDKKYREPLHKFLREHPDFPLKVVWKDNNDYYYRLLKE